MSIFAYKKPGLFIAFLLLVLVFQPAAAQDLGTMPPVVVTQQAAAQVVEATVEPTPAPTVSYLPTSAELTDTFAKYLLLIVVVALLVIGALFYRVAGMLAAGMPQWAWQGATAIGNAGLDELQRRASATPTPLDDAGVDAFRKLFDQWVAEENAKRSAVTLPAPGGDTPEASG